MQHNLVSFVIKHIWVIYFEVNMSLRYDNIATETTNTNTSNKKMENDLKLEIWDFLNWPFHISYTSLFAILDALM